MVRAACVFIAATAILAGCNDAPAKAPLPTPSAPATTALVAPPELTKHQRRAGFLPLTILLPDADGWMTGRDEAQRYEASHAPSSSTLIVVGLDGTFGTSMQCAQNDRDESLPSELRIDGGLVRAPLALDVAYELFAKEAHGGRGQVLPAALRDARSWPRRREGDRRTADVLPRHFARIAAPRPRRSRSGGAAHEP
jgi:hypothetical protein